MINLGLSISMMILAIIVWFFSCIIITERRRIRLTYLWGYSGDSYLAIREWECASYVGHVWYVFFFRNPKRLYGPLLQGVWNHTSNNVNTYDERWWDCYNHIYLAGTAINKKRIRDIMATGSYRLETAMERAGYDVDFLLGLRKPNPESKFSMVDGAEEYEEIVSGQQIMDSL